MGAFSLRSNLTSNPGARELRITVPRPKSMPRSPQPRSLGASAVGSCSIFSISGRDPTDRFIRLLKDYESSLRKGDCQILLALARRLARK